MDADRPHIEVHTRAGRSFTSRRWTGRRQRFLRPDSAAPVRVVWLGAFGTGGSARAAGGLFASMIKVFLRGQIADKQAADLELLPAGATVFHAGPLANGPLSPTGHTVPVATFSRHELIPKNITRAMVAAQMLDEAENNRYGGQILIPLS